MNFDSKKADADLDDEPVESKEPHVYTVSELNKGIRQMLEAEYGLLWIKGEISNFKAHSSGHFYFSLKDKKAQVNAVMFRGYNSRLSFRPEDGMEVIIRGKVTVYEPRGNYQVFCEIMDPVGAGALQKAYEQLKAKLQKEGLFDEARKRALPALPRRVALVTSPTGAAVRDMLNVLGRRFKGLEIFVVPTLVQGDGAPASIIKSIELANKIKDLDVMIVGRGGGSIEDLWGFNDEGVARAIVASKVPVVSAVGHEVDFTIADFVADLRAPTPSAAAELIVKNASDLLDHLTNLKRHLVTSMNHQLMQHRQTVDYLKSRLIDPRKTLTELKRRCLELQKRLGQVIVGNIRSMRADVRLLSQKLGRPDDLVLKRKNQVERLQVALENKMKLKLQESKNQWSRSSSLLDSLSPLRVVDRGYSLVKDKDGKIIKGIDQVNVGDGIKVRFAKGQIEAEVKSKKESVDGF